MFYNYHVILLLFPSLCKVLLLLSFSHLDNLFSHLYENITQIVCENKY